VLKSSPLNSSSIKRKKKATHKKFPHVAVNIFKHFRLYSCEVYYRNINKRKFDKKRIETNFLSRDRKMGLGEGGEEKLHSKKKGFCCRNGA
jgi:hypothetical protein